MASTPSQLQPTTTLIHESADLIMSTAQDINVHLRWRPLDVSQQEDGELDRHYTKDRNSKTKVFLTQSKNASSARPSTWTSTSSFTHIFETTSTNKEVFDTIVTPALPHVLLGSTCNFFAFGHTGSGKTNTIVGRTNDPQRNRLGLYFLAASRIIQDLQRINETRTDGPDVFLGIRLYELRHNKVYDLLDGRRECHAREGGDGMTYIRGETETLEGGKVRVKHIVQKLCTRFEDVVREMNAGLLLRAQGTSPVHDESSRTHAVLEMEVVSKELVDVREAVIEAQSELVPVGKRATDVYLEETMKSLIKSEDGQWVQNPDRPVDQAKIDAAEAEKNLYESYVQAAEQQVTEAIAAHPAIGGKVVFVDLAGAEYHKSTPSSARQQTAQERQEGRQINSDLLALKEVIRARASRQPRVPFRSSTLTMVLREYFRQSASCSSTMIVAASPSNLMFRATRDAVQYGALVGAG